MPTGIGKRGIGSRAGVARRQLGARYAQTDAQVPYSYPPGSWTFTAPRAGYWRFVLWGGGGNGNINGGASGSYYEAVRYLLKSQAVAIVAGGFAATSTATFPSGEVITAGGATDNTPGAATANQAADVVLQGSAPGVAGSGSSGGAANVGAGAPGNGNFRGGDGAPAQANPLRPGASPGGGGSASNNGSTYTMGGHGLAIVAFHRD